MKIFSEHDLSYWLERCMVLALERTPKLKLTAAGDATFTALAANFLDVASTVILDREGLRDANCHVYGTNKGNLGFSKLLHAKQEITQLLNEKKLEPPLVMSIIQKIENPTEKNSKDQRDELVKFISEDLNIKAGDNLVNEIYKIAHPARIALEMTCGKWKRELHPNEYLTDFSVHCNSQVMIAMESEGKHVTKECAPDLGSIEHGSIYWDFFKLLNVSSKYKFLLAVENGDKPKAIRKSLKGLLDTYIAANPGCLVEDRMWIFIFHPYKPHPDNADAAGFDMYSVETDINERSAMKTDDIESFLGKQRP